MMLRQLLIAAALLGAEPSWRAELAQIDREISQLQELQERYRSSAQRNINNAMRWQFQSENYLDARRAWDRAAQQKQKIREIQDQIDALKARRKNLLKEHAESIP